MDWTLKCSLSEVSCWSWEEIDPLETIFVLYLHILRMEIVVGRYMQLTLQTEGTNILMVQCAITSTGKVGNKWWVPFHVIKHPIEKGKIIMWLNLFKMRHYNM